MGNEGWAGRNCETKRCPDDCSGHGACDVNKGTCSCFEGWGAHNCNAQPYQRAWGYSRAGGRVGPEHWALLSPHYQTCANGKFQSPVSLPWDGTEGLMNAFYHNITFSTDTVISGYHEIDNGRHYTANMPE